MQNYTLVLDTNKQPLDPVHPAVARRLLSNGKAAVFRTDPFTIILKCGVDTPTQSIEIKLDPGSQTTGIALLNGEKLIFVAELDHRGQAIKASLDSRCAIRPGRPG